MVVCVIILLMTGCSGRNVLEIKVGKQEHEFNMSPTTKVNGEPYSIAFMDLGPPIESSYLCLRGLVEGLQQAGYLPVSMDLNKAPEEFYAFYDYVLAHNDGKYIRFCEKPYMIGEGQDDEIARDLKKRVADQELDVVVGTGTDPGLFLKELDLEIPFLICLATDPVASGIIDSADDTGDPNIWALVEENPYQRQFAGYKSIIGFQKVGFISVDEYDLIAGNSEYREAAAELGVTFEEMSFSEEETLAEGFAEKLYHRLEQTDMSDYDAVLFAYGILTDDNVDAVAELLAARGIPSLISDGDSLSANGGMMCLSSFDYINYGRYAAMVLSNVLHGENAGDQPCRYASSPHIVVNMTTADKTGFKTDFAFLRSVDTVYR